MKKIDLHIHTVKSISDADFNFSLIRLQEYVNAMNLDCIAITNHNLFDITQFREITTLLNNIVVFPGIEINLCGGHLLLISDSSNLEEFSKRADCVKNKITLATDSLSYEEFINIYPDYEKYLLIPHYDKTPSLSFETIKLFGDNIFTGEVSSPKKFIYAIKRNEIVPVLFSDCRLEALTTFSSKQTFLDIGDITLRALKVLEKVDVIAAEDTRHTLKLLNFYAITKPLISYHRHNEEVKSDVLIDKLKNGENIALVTDAGTPGISDPGEEIVKKAIENNIEIIPIPGACALINALICSGFNTKEFIFYGFLPINKKLRTKKLNEISKQNKTIILYEAPHKLLKTLNDILKNIGDINCILAKEITKIHEEYIRGKISELISRKEEIKGEYVILLDLNDNEQEDCSKKEMPLEEQYEYYEKKGLEKKEIIKQIAKDRNTNKNEIYQKFLKK